ncbi:MAG: hypothetical protein ACPLXC_00870 [Candidatus Pacearchaeota archaeon]
MTTFVEILNQFAIGFSIIFERAVEILKQPALNKDMLWILLPSIVTLFLMELYFGRYKEEELGWNSAVSNALVLFFVGMNLASWLYSHQLLIGFFSVEETIFMNALIKTLIAIFVLVESALLLFLNFFHLVKKKFAFGISSTLIINFIGVISIILVYSEVPLDALTFPAVLMTFIALVIFFRFIKLLEPTITKKQEMGEELG